MGVVIVLWRQTTAPSWSRCRWMEVKFWLWGIEIRNYQILSCLKCFAEDCGYQCMADSAILCSLHKFKPMYLLFLWKWVKYSYLSNNLGLFSLTGVVENINHCWLLLFTVLWAHLSLLVSVHRQAMKTGCTIWKLNVGQNTQSYHRTSDLWRR